MELLQSCSEFKITAYLGDKATWKQTLGECADKLDAGSCSMTTQLFNVIVGFQEQSARGHASWIAKDLHSRDVMGGWCVCTSCCPVWAVSSRWRAHWLRERAVQLFLSVLFLGHSIAGDHDTRPNDWTDCLYQLDLVWHNMVNLSKKA